LLLQIRIRLVIATRESRSVMPCSEQLNHKVRFFAFLNQLPFQLCFVSTCGGTCGLVWKRWIEDCIHKSFAGLIAEGQYLKILDRIRRCLLRAGNDKFCNCCAAQFSGTLDQTLLIQE